MKTSKIALSIYLICCFLAVIANIFMLDGLKLFTLPLLIPALFFYYYIESKKVSILICLYLLANFIGDSIGLLNFDNEIYYIIPPFFISNLVMVIILIKNIEKFKYNLLNLTALIIVGLFLNYILCIVLDLFAYGEAFIQLQVGIFGVLLILLALLTTYNIVWKINTSNLYSMISVSCLLVSYTFYIFYNFQNQLIVLNSIHFTCHVFAYLFFVKYVLLREKKTIIQY
jgi:hypothetical protein